MRGDANLTDLLQMSDQKRRRDSPLSISRRPHLGAKVSEFSEAYRGAFAIHRALSTVVSKMTSDRLENEMFKDWSRLMMLAMESQAAMSLRVMRLARNGPTPAPMVSDKAIAAVEAAGTIPTRKSSAKVVRGLKRRVPKKSRRLKRRSP